MYSDLHFLNRALKKLTPLDIMGTIQGSPLEPLGAIFMRCSKRFRGRSIVPPGAERQPLGQLYFVEIPLNLTAKLGKIASTAREAHAPSAKWESN